MKLNSILSSSEQASQFTRLCFVGLYRPFSSFWFLHSFLVRACLHAARSRSFFLVAIRVCMASYPFAGPSLLLDLESEAWDSPSTPTAKSTLRFVPHGHEPPRIGSPAPLSTDDGICLVRSHDRVTCNCSTGRHHVPSKEWWRRISVEAM